MSMPTRSTLTALTRQALAATPTTTGRTTSARRQASSFSFRGALGSLFKRKQQQQTDTSSSSSLSNDKTQDVGAVEQEQPRGLFDDATLQHEKIITSTRLATRTTPQPTFHKSSTANFKVSRRKLNDLSRLIAGRRVDEAILQLEASDKKPASRLLSMLALARNHAMAKGMSRDQLIVAQSWVTKGVYLQRLDIKGRGRFGVKHHPSAKLHVLLSQGQTKQEKQKRIQRDQYRSSVRNFNRKVDGGIGLGKLKPIVNAGVGTWRW
ncbi:hypothetical protein OIO90_004611 [Microbotryomycetes sp. JL221]|nr:hypothetical protein OIO90_004611 [Microbotryomycetes sp. JL221]